MKTNNLLIVVGLGALAYWYFGMRKPDRSGQIEWLRTWIAANSTQAGDTQVFVDVLTRMSDDELTDVYTYIHDYGSPEKMPPDLRQRIILISAKYNIFT